MTHVSVSVGVPLTRSFVPPRDSYVHEGGTSPSHRASRLGLLLGTDDPSSVAGPDIPDDFPTHLLLPVAGRGEASGFVYFYSVQE